MCCMYRNKGVMYVWQIHFVIYMLYTHNTPKSTPIYLKYGKNGHLNNMLVHD